MTLIPTLVALQGEGAPSSAFPSFVVPIALMGLIFWFVVIGPERKQRQLREAMLSDLKKGDEVLTSSGMLGKITQIQDDQVTLAVADGVKVRFLRSAISGLHGGGSGTKSEA